MNIDLIHSTTKIRFSEGLILRLLVIGLASAWCARTFANVRIKRCEARLSHQGTTFDPDLRFEAGRVVRYQNTTVPVSPAEFMLLRLIVEAPREVIFVRRSHPTDVGLTTTAKSQGQHQGSPGPVEG